MGKSIDQSAPEICFAFARPDFEIWVNKYVVNIRQRVPFHAAFRNEIEEPAPHHPLAHLAHVMQPHVPGPAAGPCEGMREPPDLEMAFQNQHAPFAQLRHDAREGQPAHAGADHDRVVFRL